ncbi:MAG: 2-phosphosulfolactate phosphatase [Nocardioidaceae bacterium]|nr:2-phosphosulfolactate phosphatase [Nocardioidaceae bacterium]
MTGAVVVVDVLRAFTTAAYAFAVGARRIWLVSSVEEALTLKSTRPRTLAMGENHGPPGARIRLLQLPGGAR